MYHLHQIVPIPIVEKTCRYNCCLIKFCPLITSFARTIHSFQGQEAGYGKAITSLIVNPGSKGFEILNPGTLYCCVSRATTMGKNDIKKSAIFFIGSDMCTDRIKNLACDANGKQYMKCILRKQWIKFLKERNKETLKSLRSFSRDKYEMFTDKLKNISISIEKIDSVIKFHIK